MGPGQAFSQQNPPPASGKKEEKYDPGTKLKKPIQVDDEDEPVIKVPGKGTTAPQSDIPAALKNSTHPVLSALFRFVSTPHDLVTFANNERSEQVKPLRDFFPLGQKPKITNNLSLTPLDQDGKELKPYGIVPAQVDSIQAFELLGIRKVEEFLDARHDRRESKDPKYLDADTMYLAAVAAMEAIAKTHFQMRESQVRRGPDWQPISDQVQEKLVSVWTKQLEYLASHKGWDKTADAAARIARAPFKITDNERVKLAQPLLGLTTPLLEGNNETKLKEAQRRLALIERLFPGTAARSTFADQLKNQAESLLAQARLLAKDGKTQEALKAIDDALGIWPNLPGLQDEGLKLRNAYPVLRVGVRSLPVNFVPGMAATGSEQFAQELLFESLVRPTFSSSGNQDYAAVLAEGPPHLLPLGRQVQILSNVAWSDGRKDLLSGQDVVHTIQNLKSDKWPVRNQSWNDLIEGVRRGKDDNQVTILFARGHPDPLSALCFKILPRNLDPEGISRFNADPVGSGPFMLVKPEGETKEMVFVANKYYAQRHRSHSNPSPLMKPRIREIHFVKVDDPIKDLVEGNLDLYVNPPPSKISFLAKAASVAVEGPLPNRRIYYLAVNHQQRLLKDQNFRRALAHLINRNQALQEAFRGDLGDQVHHALGGPYPAGSWACKPDMPKTLDDVNQGTLFFDSAKKSLNIQGAELSLKYPAGDPAVEIAMKNVAAQIKKLTGIRVEAQAVELHALREDVERKQDYDLAYYHYDFPSESYWLGLLVDQNNFFNFRGDAAFQLQALFNQVQNFRSFERIKELTQTIHERFNSSMPFIPLWQLDTFVAHSRSLTFGPRHSKDDIQDPVLIFPGVEDWVLERK